MIGPKAALTACRNGGCASRTTNTRISATHFWRALHQCCISPFFSPGTDPSLFLSFFPIHSLLVECLCWSAPPRYTMHIGHDLPEVPRSEPVLPPSSQEIPSSPPSIASDAGVRRKPKKPPPVTPRSFRKFFTPRSMLNGGNSGGVKTNRQALKALSSPAINRLGPAFARTAKASGSRPALNEPANLTRTPSRKRKFSFSSVGSPLQSSPLRKVRIKAPVEDEEEIGVPVKELGVGCEEQDDETKSIAAESIPPKPVSPIRRSQALQTSGGLYMRNVLGSRADRVTLRSNSGAGWLISMEYLRNVSFSPYSRMARFDIKLLFPPRRHPFLRQLYW